MELNPIIVREMRARHSRRTALALAGGATALLLAGLWWWSASQSHSDRYFGSIMWLNWPRLAHELFLTLTWAQTLGWLLLPPALTATTIAGEREKGLLDGLQISPLAPRQIVAGKLTAALLPAAGIFLLLLPLNALCWLLGGVETGRFAGVMAVLAATALLSASVGLCCSAWSRRTSSALVWSYVALFAGFIISLAAYGVSYGPGPDSFFNLACGLIGLANPLWAAMSLADPNTVSPRSLVSPSFTLVWDAALTSGLWWLAVRAVRRPLAEPQHFEATPAAPPPMPLAIDHPEAAPPAIVEAAEPSRELSRLRGRWEVPGLTRLRFDNPVMQREWRERFRIQKAPWPAMVVAAVGALCLVFIYGVVLREMLRDAWTRNAWGGVAAYLGLAVLMTIGAVLGAGAFSREREAKTWDALALSLLTPGEIVRGKLLAMSGAGLLFSLPLWPLLILGSVPYRNPSIFDPNAAPILYHQAAALTLVILAAMWAATCWSMLLSWRCQRTTAATTWSLASLLIALLIVPVMAASFGVSLPPEHLVNAWHPFYLMIQLHNMHGQGPVVLEGALGALRLFLLGGVCLLLLHHAIGNGHETGDAA